MNSLHWMGGNNTLSLWTQCDGIQLQARLCPNITTQSLSMVVEALSWRRRCVIDFLKLKQISKQLNKPLLCLRPDQSMLESPCSMCCLSSCTHLQVLFIFWYNTLFTIWQKKYGYIFYYDSSLSLCYNGLWQSNCI